MNGRPILCCIACLIFASPVFADIDAVIQLGLRPNDPTFDNGRVITESFAAGKIRDTLHFKGGIYYHTTPIVLSQDSLSLTGQGMSRWRRAGAFENTAAVIFIYLGPAEHPAWKISGDGISLRGLNIWRDFYAEGRGRKAEGGRTETEGSGPQPSALSTPPPNPQSPAPSPARSVGIEWTDWGKRDVTACSFAGWDIAWRFAPSNHNDCSVFTHIGFSGCRVCVRGEERQSSAIDWRGIYVHGEGETVLDLSMGGNYNFDTLAINEPRLILRLRQTSPNTCTYTINNLKVDNNAAGWRLLQMDKPGPLNLRVRGNIGQRATTGDHPIAIRRPKTATYNPPTDYHVLNVELWGPNPVGGAVWRPTLEQAYQSAPRRPPR
jgi:hypothetical protein